MTFSNLNLKNFKALYSTYGTQHLDYCLQNTGSRAPPGTGCAGPGTRTKYREGCEAGARALLPCKKRLQKLDLQIVKDRSLLGDLIKECKILTSKVNIDPGPEQFFVLQEDSRTRGNHLKLEKTRASHYYRNNSLLTEWSHSGMISLSMWSLKTQVISRGG